jgi:GxxExxY protein
MDKKAPISLELNQLAKVVVDAAFQVHKTLGPGLLESVYEVCLAHELIKRGLSIETQVYLPIAYDNVILESGLKLDVIVNDQLILELKSVELLLPVHHAQLLTCLKLSNKRLGLLINFNVPVIKLGIKRIVL